MRQISLRQLRIFAEVARGGSVSEACRTLDLSRPTISEALRDLEAALGRELFDRTGRSLRLNPAGRALLPDAARVVADTEAIGRRHARRSFLAIGSSVTAGNYFLAPLLLSALRQAEALELDVTVRNTEAIVAALLGLEIEAGVVEGAVSHPELRVLPWRRDAQAIVAAPGHPLVHARRVEELEHADWVLREKGSGTREAFEAEAARWPFEPRARITVGGNELLKRIVADGDGLGCLSEAAAAGEIARGELAAVRPEGVRMERTLSLVLPLGRPPQPALIRLLQLFHQSADADLAPALAEALDEAGGG